MYIVGLLAAIAIPSIIKIRENKEMKKGYEALAKKTVADNLTTPTLSENFTLEKEDANTALIKEDNAKMLLSEIAKARERREYDVTRMFEVDGVTFYRAKCGIVYFFFSMTTNSNIKVEITAERKQ